MQNGYILVRAYPGPPGKWPLKQRQRERERERESFRDVLCIGAIQIDITFTFTVRLFGHDEAPTNLAVPKFATCLQVRLQMLLTKQQDDLTVALRVLYLQLSPPPPSSLAPIKPANPGPPGKWLLRLQLLLLLQLSHLPYRFWR